MAADKKLLNIKELSQYLGIPVWTLYSWVNQKRIPYIKAGRLLRFDPDDIDEWLEKKKVMGKKTGLFS